MDDNLKECYYHSQGGDFYYLDSCLTAAETIVFLHGFTGSSRDFLTIPDALKNNYRCLIPDLPGHGKTHILEDANFFPSDRQVALLEQWLDSLGQTRIHLLGYSMGGRLALQFAVKNSHRLQSLILVSTTAGIKEDSERNFRVNSDEKLVNHILNSSPVDFLQSWLVQPLFQPLTDKGQDFINQEIQRRLPIQPSGLACSLKYFGSGVMPSVWHRLSDIKTPTLIIAGNKDRKYLAIANQLVTLIPEAKLNILKTGHAPMLESPTIFWEKVAKFLLNLLPEFQI